MLRPATRRRPLLAPRTAWLVLTSVFVAAGTLLAGPGVASAAGAGPTAAAVAPTASTSKMHVVGGPVAAEGAAVVITVDAKHNLRLEGVAPDSGHVVWSRPFSVSGAEPYLPPDPEVLDNVVLDPRPVDKPTDPLVNVDGIDATTGALAWHGPRGVLLSDTPGPCEQETNFCITAFNENGSGTLAVLDPSTGRPVGVLSGPTNAIDWDLYQTDAKKPTLEALSRTGTVAWKKTFAQLFGPGYDPVNGWDSFSFDGRTEVATVGANAQGHSEGLDNARTIGFSLATGATTWTLPGEYQCGGSLGIEDPAFDCVYSGRELHPKQTTYKGLRLVLQGFDPATGKVTWSRAVADVDALTDGTVAFLDGSHLVVQLQDGKTVLLDTADGSVAAPAPGQSLWCTKSSEFKVNENKDVNPSHYLPDEGVDFPCTAQGKPTRTLPATNPDAMGVTVDGVFLWASPGGLSRRVVGAAEGSA